jgi:seryl-tRNA synthetase
MFVYSLPQESETIHDQLLAIEEEIFQGLEIPYHVVDTCTGDLGAPAYRKYDIEAWMPGRGDEGAYGEVTSTSNCTDYQSRRLNIRYRDSEGRIQHVHLLNGTAIAISRALVALLENFQREDGSIKIPQALVPYTAFTEIRR